MIVPKLDNVAVGVLVDFDEFILWAEQSCLTMAEWWFALEFWL